MTRTNDTNDDDLPALRAPTSGRRSDDAFARAVKADIDAKRAPAWRRALVYGGPALAGAAAVVVAVGVGVGDDSVDRAALVKAVNAADVAVDLDAFADDDLAFNDDDDDSEFGDDFAIPGLAGSTEQELAAIEAALDDALKG
jgi:hypothetical protein